MKLPPKILLILPGSVYFISYLYLAGYHGDVFLFDKLVHEGGTHTLLESIFYFSHFLAHSVRELLTFPLTYFPIPLYFLYQGRNQPEGEKTNKRLIVIIACLAVVFLAGLVYQSVLPLSRGIGELAQKPAFAEGGRLSIAYLLASHYFEHVLDSIYFTLLCLLLYGYAVGRRHNEPQNP